MNEKVNTIFISPVTFTSDFDVALNTRNAGQGSVFCVIIYIQRFKVIDCQETVSEPKCYQSTMIERPTYLSTSLSAQRITFSIFLLIFNKYNVMIILQN